MSALTSQQYVNINLNGMFISWIICQLFSIIYLTLYSNDTHISNWNNMCYYYSLENSAYNGINHRKCAAHEFVLTEDRYIC